MPSRETGVIRFCVATHRRSVVRQTFSLAWPMRARPWTACARASSTADTEPTIDVLINNAGRMLVTCWKDVAGDDTRESSHFGAGRGHFGGGSSVPGGGRIRSSTVRAATRLPALGA